MARPRLPGQRVGIEYEGSDHLDPRRVLRDTHRYTGLVELGWRMYRFTAADVYRRPDQTADRVRRALQYRG